MVDCVGFESASSSWQYPRHALAKSLCVKRTNCTSFFPCLCSPYNGQVGDDLKAKVDQVGRKAQNALGNTSGLPSPQEAVDKVKGAANEVGRKAGGLGDNNPLSGNVPSPQEVSELLAHLNMQQRRKIVRASALVCIMHSCHWPIS